VRPVVAVVGPTATGKSDLGVALAQALDGEVVNADASQLYRGMDIGTAKLPPDERGGVTHHLLDVLDVHEEASVAAYQRQARAAFDDVRSRGRVPVLVGGSGLYVRAALDQMEFPGTDASVRARLEEEADALGGPALHARLTRRDPLAAANIAATNVRRVVRALEAIEVTGMPFSSALPPHTYAVPAVQLGLRIPRELLDQRIAERVDAMWARGLVDEVRGLEHRGLREGRTASRALGYAQVLAFLSGTCGSDQAREDTVRGTRRFARRQESWFRRDPRVRWLDAGVGPDVGARVPLVRRALDALDADGR